MAQSFYPFLVLRAIAHLSMGLLPARSTPEFEAAVLYDASHSQLIIRVERVFSLNAPTR
jgi:hypothetical protein